MRFKFDKKKSIVLRKDPKRGLVLKKFRRYSDTRIIWIGEWISPTSIAQLAG